MPKPLSHRRALALALTVTVLWASSWVIIRYGLDDEGLRPLTFAGIRYVLAGLALLAVGLASQRTRHAMKSMTKGEWWFLALWGLVGVAISQGGQFVALDNQPAATTSLVLAVTPLLVVALSGRSLGEWATPHQIIGAVLVVAGAVLYFSGELEATRIGMIAAVTALTFNAFGSMMGRGVHRSGERSPLVTTGVSMVIGASLLLGVGLALEGLPATTVRGWVIIGWLAFVNGSLAWWMWNLSLRRLTATESSVIASLMLVQIAALSWIFLSEVPSAWQIVGIVAVTIGVIGSQLGRRGGATTPR